MQTTGFSRQRRVSARQVIGAAALVATLGLSGCASGGVELNGKIFDVMGVSSSALAASRREAKVPERAPLVMPPSTELRAPGSVPVQQAAVDPNWPQDAERIAAREDVERQQQVAAMCKDREWMERTRPREFATITENGALCTSQAAKWLEKMFGNETAATQTE